MASRPWSSTNRLLLPAGFSRAGRLILAALSGAILSLSFYGAHPSFYSWFCLAILLFSLLGARARVAFFGGFLHGMIFVVTCVPWVAEVLSVHGGMSTTAGWAVLLLIAAVWGSSIGLFAWMVQRLSQQGIGLAFCGAPFLWISTEVFRAYLPEISFPWGLLGYPAAGNPAIVQLTTITGIYGVSFLVAVFNSLLVWILASPSEQRKSRLAVVTCVLLVLLTVQKVGPRFVPTAAAGHVARVVQPNFPETEQYVGDWYADHKADMAELERLSLRRAPGAQQPDLLVWPEAPAPFSLQDPHFAPYISSLAAKFQYPVIVGIIDWKPVVESGRGVPRTGLVPYNSAAMLNSIGQKAFTYDKIHLVPFGEYEPFPLIHQVVTSVSEEVGGFHKGKERNVGHFAGGNTFSVFICYEAIYAGEIRQFANNGAQLLVNISNDGWFGKSEAAEQHLRMARVRAVENRRWLIRDTNSGITASIDPYGNVTRAMQRDTRDAADLPYDFRTGKTIYTRFGDWFAWMCVAISAILVLLTFRKAK
ncbi:MAG TPA: apolipoprotein N-acyltransferase [Candidatus Sulfotelmatobacter sp.]|jgi:apolipoprotein N-acyltransferase|nr:apolipoprotein N-acyltransferase [Candidatus Sulfotelmatobacter sp.]